MEIIERIKAYHADCLRALENGTAQGGVSGNYGSSGTGGSGGAGSPEAARRSVLVKPPRKVWNHSIEEFHLSGLALAELHDCGITYIRLFIRIINKYICPLYVFSFWHRKCYIYLQLLKFCKCSILP